MGNFELEWRKAFFDLDSHRLGQVDGSGLLEKRILLDREGRPIVGGRRWGDDVAWDISYGVGELIRLQPAQMLSARSGFWLIVLLGRLFV
jgi:hypothetical protein